MLLAAVSLAWAGSYALIKLALVDMAPLTLTASRLAIAAAVLAAWVRLRGFRVPLEPWLWGRYAAIAVLGQAVPFFLIAWAETLVTTAETAVLVATTPMFAMLFVALAEKRWPSPGISLGFGLGFLGVVGFLWADAGSASEWHWLAWAALILAATGFAVAACLVGGLPPSPPAVTGLAVTTCGAAIFLPASLLIDRPWLFAPSASGLAAVLALGVFSTAIVYVLYYRLVRISGPGFASLHHYLVPAIAVGLGALALGERVTPLQLIFAGGIVLGIGLSSACRKPRVSSSTGSPLEGASGRSAHLPVGFKRSRRAAWSRVPGLLTRYRQETWRVKNVQARD